MNRIFHAFYFRLRINHLNCNAAVKCYRLSFDENLKPSSNFIAGRPKVALLFWFFGGFRCGVPLFIAMLVIC